MTGVVPVPQRGCGPTGHTWSAWVERPASLPRRKPSDVEVLRWCTECNKYEGLSSAGVKAT